VTAVPPPAKRGLASRSGLFYTLAVAGTIVSIVLGFRAIVDQPVVTLSTPFAQRTGLRDVVTVIANNRSSSTTYCATVRIAALDQSGNQLEGAKAVPLGGSNQVSPTGSTSFRAVFTHLSATDYTQKLDKFEAFLVHSTPCG
jgi:hypothetical protein